MLLAAMTTLSGCYWISGPWTAPDKIRDRYAEVEDGMLREDVEDIMKGPPSEIIYPGETGRPLEGSKEAWLLYKYDYPNDPLLASYKIDYFGILTEKHWDDSETVSALAERRLAEEKTSYPGAPQRRFQEMLKKKHRQQGAK
jgi:hypothetical protein